MQLPPEQVERFYAIWKPLMLFVNRRQKLVPEMLHEDFAGPWLVPNVHTIRNALWADDSLLEAFLAENPAHLSPEDQAIVASWRHRLEGGFFVLRHLKKHSLFLAEKETTLYGVLGLTSPLAEVVPFVPCYVKAVLLPFDDVIIYDSLIVPYNVTFGRGIRSGLERQYRDAKERGAIVTSLLPQPEDHEESAEAAVATDKRVLDAFRAHLYGSGLSTKVAERDLANVNAFAEDYLLMLPEPRSLRDFGAAEVEGFLSLPDDGSPSERRPMATSLRRFLRFLRDSGRMEYDAAEDALEILKEKR